MVRVRVRVGARARARVTGSELNVVECLGVEAPPSGLGGVLCLEVCLFVSVGFVVVGRCVCGWRCGMFDSRVGQ